MYIHPGYKGGSVLILQALLHCYSFDCVTHFMFSPGGLNSLDSSNDFGGTYLSLESTK